MMEVLLDTHALYWAIDDPKKLSPAALAALQQVERPVVTGTSRR